MNKYLSTLAISLILCTGVVATISFVIDPFSIWKATCIEDLSCKKTEAGRKIYITKSFQWEGIKPEVIILGNSRPEMGLNPSSTIFGGRNVYNLSIRGASLEKQALYFANIIISSKPSELLLGIDFFDFLTDKHTTETWPVGLDKDSYLETNLSLQKNKYFYQNYVKSHIYSLVSLDGLISSFKTMFSQTAHANYLQEDGFNMADGFIAVVENEGLEVAFKHSEKLLRKSITNESLGLSNLNSGNNAYRSLNFIIDNALRNNIKVTLFINPYHERYLRVIRDVGKFEMFLKWKVDVNNFLHDNSYSTKINLYDFSGFNRFTNEAVPHEKGEYMDWFWEPAHYTAALGEIMLSEIFNGSDTYQLDRRSVERKNLYDRNQMSELMRKR
jgi:hypothetical protein